MVWNVAGELVSPKKMTVGSNSPLFVLKGGFPLVLLLYAYIVVSPSDVELGKPLLVYKLLD